MVHMAAVGMHRALALGDAADDREADIEDRQTEHKERHGKRDDRIHLEQAVDGDGREHKAEECRAGVAHEDLCRVEIIRDEARARADDGR